MSLNNPSTIKDNAFWTKLYPWIAIALSSAFLIYEYIIQVSPSIMTSQLMREFHVQGAGLGNLAATFLYSYLVAQLFAGVLLDRYSTRYLTTAAIAIMAVGTFFFARAETLLVAELSRIFMGIGAAFATVSYMKVAATWFKPAQFAFVAGLLATAAMFGAVVGQAPFSLMVNHLGWRGGLVMVSFVGLALAFFFFLIVRDRKINPAFAGSHPVPHNITLKDVLGVLRNPQNWLLTIYSGLSFAPIVVFGGLWGNPFLREAYNINTTQAASLVSLSFIGLAFGGPILGFISDRLHNRRKVMFFGALFSLLGIIMAIYFILPIWLLSIMLFIFGFSTGGFMLGFVVGKEINNIAVAATVIALINTGDALFGSISEPLAGRILDLNWSGQIAKGVHVFSLSNYHIAFLLLPIYLLLAMVLVYFIREPNHK